MYLFYSMNTHLDWKKIWWWDTGFFWMIHLLFGLENWMIPHHVLDILVLDILYSSFFCFGCEILDHSGFLWGWGCEVVRPYSKKSEKFVGGHDCIKLCNSWWRKFLFTLADFGGQMLFWSQFEMSRKLPFKYGRL